MMASNDITITELKRTLPAERYYKDRLKGSWGKVTGHNWHMWNGLCPFHNDKHAGSLVVNRRTGAFKCFSCGANGGDIIDFEMKLKNVNFKEAFNKLKEVVLCKK